MPPKQFIVDHPFLLALRDERTGTLLFIGVIGRFKPEWLRALAEFLQSAPFVYFLAGYVVFLVVTVAIGIRILNT